jgi:hypothetical protein
VVCGRGEEEPEEIVEAVAEQPVPAETITVR